jgi:hypothetical protein
VLCARATPVFVCVHLLRMCAHMACVVYVCLCPCLCLCVCMSVSVSVSVSVCVHLLSLCAYMVCVVCVSVCLCMCASLEFVCARVMLLCVHVFVFVWGHLLQTCALK